PASLVTHDRSHPLDLCTRVALPSLSHGSGLPKPRPLPPCNAGEEDAVRGQLERSPGHPARAEAMIIQRGKWPESRQRGRLGSVRQIEGRQNGLGIERASERKQRLRQLDEVDVSLAESGLMAAPAQETAKRVE